MNLYAVTFKRYTRGETFGSVLVLRAKDHGTAYLEAARAAQQFKRFAYIDTVAAIDEHQENAVLFEYHHD